ncbi:C-5 cytosine-specific DNA methylase [compost metagenome]
MYFDDYVEWQRMSHDRENKELIEILSLEHYLKLKEEEFEFEGQSYLFWEYIRILTDIRKYNPEVKFLLENVIMGKKWQKVITQAIGINPIRINAALVSAQNRDRLFWTNIYTEQDGFFGDLKCMIPHPKDEGILLKDVLETFETSNFETQEEFDAYMKKYFLSDKMMSWLEKHSEKRGSVFKKLDGFQKASTITCTEEKQNLSNDYVVHNTMPRSSKTGKGGTGHLSRTDGKTYCLDTGNTNAVEVNIVAMRGRNPDNPKSRESGLPTEQQLEPRFDGKTNCITSVQKDNLVMQINPSKESGGVQPYQQNLIYDSDGIMPALNAQLGERNNILTPNKTIRRLTPRECGRLQSVPEDKLEILLNSGIRDTQLYKMFGNGWNCKVIQHILKHLD